MASGLSAAARLSAPFRGLGLRSQFDLPSFLVLAFRFYSDTVGCSRIERYARSFLSGEPNGSAAVGVVPGRRGRPIGFCHRIDDGNGYTGRSGPHLSDHTTKFA